MDQLIRPRKSSHQSPANTISGYVAPVEPLDSAFCNSFWIQADKKLLPGTDPAEVGSDGYNTIMQRMKTGSRTLEDLRSFLKERATYEDELAKKLSRQSKIPLGSSEIGHLLLAMQQIAAENDVVGRVHAELANVLREQEAKVAGFLAKRDGSRKLQQTAIERAWKNKVAHESAVNKARAKYEADCMSINTLHAQASLSQGRDLDKVSSKLDKAQSSAAINERDFSNYAKVLQETNATWVSLWKTYLDVCQDQEEERCDYIKNRAWDYANAISTEAVSTDLSAERIRVALEQCSPVRDLKIFVQQKGTGNDIQDPPVFVNYASKEPSPQRTWRKARFTRSSTRAPGRSNAPSSVQEITKSFPSSTSLSEKSSAPLSAGSSSDRTPENRRSSSFAAPPVDPTSLLSTPSSSSSSAGNGNNSSTSSSSKKPALTGLAALENAISPSRSSSSLLVRHPSNDPLNPSLSTSSSTGAVAQDSDNITPTGTPRYTASSSNRSFNPPPSSSSASSARPSDFPPRNSSAKASTNEYNDGFDATPSPPTKRDAMLPTRRKDSLGAIALGGEEEEDDDPLMKAYNVLRSTPSSSAMRTNPSGGAGSSSRQQQQRSRPGSIVILKRSMDEMRQEQQTLGRVSGDRPRTSSRPSSPAHSITDYHRPRSPAPTASMMSAPARDAAPSPVSAVLDSYAQSFPGEREERRQGASRQQSTNTNRYSNGPSTVAGGSAIAPAGEYYGRTPSPQPFAGVGARGRSPSPQAFGRSPSPAPRGAAPGYPSSSSAAAVSTSQSRPLQQQQQLYGQSFALPAGSTLPPSQSFEQHGRPLSAQYIRSPSPGPPLHYQQQQQQQVPAGYYAQIASSSAAQPLQGQQAVRHPSYPSQLSYSGSPSGAAPAAIATSSPGYLQQQQQHGQIYPAQQQPQSSPYRQPSLYQQQQVQQSPGYSHALGAEQSEMMRTSSAHSQAGSIASQGSGNSGYRNPGAAASSYQSPPPGSQQQQRSLQHQQSPALIPRPLSVGGGGTGQFAESGVPILCFVKALYDYDAPAGGEYFSFRQGDRIAVTLIRKDGWWISPQGTFPSNFTERIP